MTLVGAILARADRALPATSVEWLDGWRLRYDDTAAWWVSSVQPHADADPRQVVRVEEFYHRRGVPARFQISPAARPAGLDQILAARGYRIESPMSLQTAATEGIAAPRAEVRVRVDDHPVDRWFSAWCAVHNQGGDPDPELRMLRRVAQPSGYAYALLGDDVVAVGRAVADTGWAGIFGMATLPRARRRGAARAVLAGLARWAADQSAAHLYLQVERDNVAALRLYTAAGFRELAQYHYRTRAGG